MKTWIELNDNVYSYFHWFDKNKFATGPSGFGVLSFNGSFLFGQDKRTSFVEESAKYFQKIFEDEALSPYSLYIQANLQADGISLKMDRYMKVWRKLQKEWSLDAFHNRPEVEFVVNENIYFSSLAKFEPDQFAEVFRLISRYSDQFLIFATKRPMLTEESVREMFVTSFAKKQEADYQNLVLTFPENIVFRWGDSAEDAEVALISNHQVLREVLIGVMPYK